MATVTCPVESMYMQTVLITLHALGTGYLGNGADAISVDGSDWPVLHGDAGSSQWEDRGYQSVCVPPPVH